MIKIFHEKKDITELFTIGQFPANELLIKVPDNSSSSIYDIDSVSIVWLYESDREMFTISCLRKKLAEYMFTVDLVVPYLPNARMDRVSAEMNVPTLKYFSQWLNALKFDTVYVLDVHSPVSTDLINNIVNKSPKYYIQQVLDNYANNGKPMPVLCFPDKGAMGRYKPLFPNCDYAYGKKIRDFNTGKISRLDILSNVELKGKDVLIIDDISSYGGTFYYSARALKEHGVNDIQLYVSHAEDSIFKGKLAESDLISLVWTVKAPCMFDKVPDTFKTYNSKPQFEICLLDLETLQEREEYEKN